MINGIAMPAQMQMGQVATAVNSVEQGRAMNSGGFGSVLASLTEAVPVIQESIMNDTMDTTEVLTELLQATTAEELTEVLQEHGYELSELFEVIEGHLVFPNDEVVDLLTAIIPGFEQLGEQVQLVEQVGNELGEQVSKLLNNGQVQLIEQTGNELDEQQLLAVDIRELFALLEEVAEEVIEKLGQDELPENLTKDQLIMLIAVMQVATIEGPKMDLTLKQEQQLHSLQEVVKTLGIELTEENQKVDQNKVSARPLQEAYTQTKLPITMVGQSAHSFAVGMGMESAKVDGESQGNTRAELLMRELQNVFKRANFGQTGGTNRISIKLYPEHLGQLRIELLQTNGLLTARILASNALGKDMLESQLHQLRQAFLQQNIQVERIDISQMMTETPYDERNNAFNQHFKQDQEQTNEQGTHEEEEEIMSFEEYMIELEA